MSSEQAIEDLKKKIDRTQSRILAAKVVLQDENRSKRQVQINLNHLQRHIKAITEYEEEEF